jgi:hypothetical protein
MGRISWVGGRNWENSKGKFIYMSERGKRREVAERVGI